MFINSTSHKQVQDVANYFKNIDFKYAIQCHVCISMQDMSFYYTTSVENIGSLKKFITMTILDNENTFDLSTLYSTSLRMIFNI